MNMSFSQQLAHTARDIVKRSENKKNGIIDGVPFPYSRFQDLVPSICERGLSSALLGASGVGKSTLARELFVFQPLLFSKANNYPIKVIYFALEDDFESIIKKTILYVNHKINDKRMSYWSINSKKRFLSEGEIANIKAATDVLKTFKDQLMIVDDCFTPDQIKAKMDELEASGYINRGKDHVCVIIDNYANIQPDDGERQWDAIGRLSAGIIRLDFCKTRKYSVLSILQEDLDQNKYAFRNAGKVNLAAIEPSTAVIAGNKGVVRDFKVLLGVFNPHKYEIMSYPHVDDYDISVMQNSFRSLLLLKTNDGEQTNARLGLRFFGETGVFEEMPTLDEKAALERIYEEVKNERLLKKQKFVQVSAFR